MNNPSLQSLSEAYAGVYQLDEISLTTKFMHTVMQKILMQIMHMDQKFMTKQIGSDQR